MAVINRLHDIIYFHRKQARLSRMELADMAGVGKTVIYDLEKGKETVKWSTVQAVLKALNVKIRFESPLMQNNEKSSGKNA